MKLKILITGYKGFIGKNMTIWLNAQNHLVEGWDWDPSLANWPRVDHYDWVVHLGAVADVNEPSVEKCLRQNYDFSRWLFEQCNQHGVNLQYASTSSVYGQTRDFDEFSECFPNNAYAWSKYLFDRWVFEQPVNIMVQGFRYFNVYGEHMGVRGKRSNVIHKWMEEAESKGTITVYEGADRNRRDFTYVGDVCRLHTDFMEIVKGSGIWNVGTGLTYTYLEIAQDLSERTGAVIHYEPIPDVSQFRTYTCADLSHLKKAVGARPWTSVYQWLDTQYK